MQYRQGAGGQEWSALGFGCMRFPREGGRIIQEEADREVRKAVELGVNYFDTAYIYPGSEECLGQILEKNRLRERVMIATKLPQYLISSSAAIEKYFQEQLLLSVHSLQELLLMFQNQELPVHLLQAPIHFLRLYDVFLMLPLKNPHKKLKL